MKEIRCEKCNKKLAEIDQYIQINIKCSRCRTLNQFRALEPKTGALREPKSTSHTELEFIIPLNEVLKSPIRVPD